MSRKYSIKKLLAGKSFDEPDEKVKGRVVDRKNKPPTEKRAVFWSGTSNIGKQKASAETKGSIQMCKDDGIVCVRNNNNNQGNGNLQLHTNFVSEAEVITLEDALVAKDFKTEHDIFTLSTSCEKMENRDDKTEFKMKFFSVFYFPMLFLTLGGFGIGRKKSLLKSLSRKNSKVKRILSSFLTMSYRAFVCAVHVFNLFRIIGYSLTSVPKANESGVARYLVSSIGMLYGTVIYISEHIVLRIHFSKFLDCLASYQSTNGFLNDIGKKQRRLKCVTFLVVACDMFTAVGWDALGSENSDDFVSFPFKGEHMTPPVKVLVHVLFCALVFLVCIPIYGVLMFYTTILDTLRAEFKATNKTIAKVLETYDESSEIQFDKCRQRYQTLCQMVVVFSQLTRGYVVVSFFFHMTSMFVSIFGLSSSALSSDIVKYQVFAGMAFNLLLLLFLTAKWGLLHTAAHSVAQAVNNAPWELKSKKLLQKMSLLLSQCATHKVGINVFGLFIIDTSTPLMVTGTLITYGIVVLQFQMGQNPVHRYPCYNLTYH